MNRKHLVLANWKMNPATLTEAKRLFSLVKRGVKDVKNVEVVICPPYVYLPILQRSNDLAIKLGAQDCFWEEEGAFTGEVSPLMLKNLKAEYVIIGHSERRRYLNETDKIINKKLKAVLKNGLKPILCIGETAKERKSGKTENILKNQLSNGLRDISNIKLQNSNIIVAYEPIWAIGTGIACNEKEARLANLFIKKLLKNVPLLYGGSVDSKNAKDYINAGFQGLLVGGASLKAKEFVKIIKNLAI